MRTIEREIVAGLVESRDHMLLFGMKDPESGGVYVDCWHTPGGGVEDGETHEQALAREMREELGLDINSARISLLDDKGTGTAEKTIRQTGERVAVFMKFYVYKIDYTLNTQDITVVPGDDIAVTKWVTRDNLATIKLTPPSVELFHRLGWLRDH